MFGHSNGTAYKEKHLIVIVKHDVGSLKLCGFFYGWCSVKNDNIMHSAKHKVNFGPEPGSLCQEVLPDTVFNKMMSQINTEMVKEIKKKSVGFEKPMV